MRRSQSKYLRRHFTGPIIAAGGFDGESAEAIVASGDADLVAFGRHFSSNPDLPYSPQAQAAAHAVCPRRILGRRRKALLGFPRLSIEAIEAEPAL